VCVVVTGSICTPPDKGVSDNADTGHPLCRSQRGVRVVDFAGVGAYQGLFASRVLAICCALASSSSWGWRPADLEPQGRSSDGGRGVHGVASWRRSSVHRSYWPASRAAARRRCVSSM
jgi:hypothetical protein